MFISEIHKRIVGDLSPVGEGDYTPGEYRRKNVKIMILLMHLYISSFYYHQFLIYGKLLKILLFSNYPLSEHEEDK